MAEFGIRFFLCNILISAIIGSLLIIKRALINHLTSRMQFNLWFLLLGLFAVPFIPIRMSGLSQLFLWLEKLKNTGVSSMGAVAEPAFNTNTSGTTNQLNDFALSISDRTPSVLGLILLGIWLIGILAMLFFMVKSNARLCALKKSALPLQNKDIRMLYRSCLSEMGIKRKIPIYSTAFLKSPIIVGLLMPRIYLPIHMISEFHMDTETPNEVSDFHGDTERHKETSTEYFHAADMRYMLLHELQHYQHKDALANYLMNLFGILYWFNPFVWYALREMRNDRELACDASVLKMLEETDYENYGNALIHFAEKISLRPFPFTAGISGSMKQMQKRIINISSYQKPSAWKSLKGVLVFSIIAMILWGLTPLLSTYAADQNHYQWSIASEKISMLDLSAYFREYEGSFVLYDQKNDAWSIYDMEHATLRVPPNSTCKIYDALFGLEEGIITPTDSFLAWNGTEYPFEAWNANQDLYSAMASSVNWYFQEIEEQLGISTVRSYIQKIRYGNKRINSVPSSFGMQSALKISPVEQVELLINLYNNDFAFHQENINAVKDSICLFSSEKESFYGKTGTGQIDGQDVNGWFVGFVETDGNTYFFAANIQNDANATRSNAAELTKSILASLNIWQ